MKEKVLLGWSSGKDSAMALYELTRNFQIEVASLLTTVTEGYDRISMHGVRRQLLREQAGSLGYTLDEISIPQNCTNEEYEKRMGDALERYRREGISAAAFGDLFLEDIRNYREDRMRRVGMRCLFPVWGRPTAEFAREFIGLGFRAILVCVDTAALSGDFAGREYNHELLRDLPPGVDPCGENGEFHTFVYDGPIFNRPLQVRTGEKVLRDNRFCFCDLHLPDDGRISSGDRTE